MDYIAQPKDYWIALQAIKITLNALGNPNRMQGSVASGAAILCYIEGVDGLGYDNGHRFRTWPLAISPTYFNSNTEKYVYVAIPRSETVGTQAIVVFPSEQLDIYGKNVGNAQIGSTDYYYIWLQGIITATDGTSNREWQQAIDFGKKGTDEDLYDDTTSEWYVYSKVSEVVTFLKNITMKTGTTFHNLILGYKELTGVTSFDTAYTDSDTLVATPGYVDSQYLSKTHESTAQEETGFVKGLWVKVKGLFGIDADGNIKGNDADLLGDLNVGGDTTIDGILHVQAKIVANQIESDNYTGEGFADTGYRLTSDDGTGSSALTVDNLHVRKKATFEELEVKKETAIAGNQVYSCAANVITRTDYYNGSGDVIGYSKIRSPWLLKGLALVLGKRADNFKLFGRYKKVRVYLPDASQINYIRCYFLAKDGDREVENMWQAGKKDGERWQNHGNDLARCQTMNLKNSNRKTYISSVGEYKLGNVYWWRKVINVSSEPVTIDGQEYHYFDVAMGDCDAGSDIPAAGDNVVQFGNDSDPDRMNIIVLEVNGSDAPAEKFYEGIHNYNLNDCYYGGHTMKTRLSPKAGYKFQGSKFEIVTEYAVTPVPIERGEWVRGTTYYYYNLVQHNGASWLCVASAGNEYTVVEDIMNGSRVVYPKGAKLNQTQYDALTVAQKQSCTRTATGSTTLEPSEANSAVWRYYAKRGTSIKSVIVTYAKQIAAQYNGNPPTSGWKSTIDAVGTLNEGDYLWTKTVTSYSDTLNNTTTYTVSKWGIDGDGIDNIETKFYEDSALLTQAQLAALAESKWKEYSQLSLTQGDYIYTRTKITYDKTSTPTINYQVNRIGQDGVGYVGTEEYYCLGDSMTTPPAKHPYQGTNHQPDIISPATMASRMNGGSWSEARPTYDTSTAQSRAKKYLWNFEAGYTTEANKVQITEPICIANYEKGILSIIETYAISAFAVASQSGGYPSDITSWTDEAHDCAPTDAKPYQWNKTETTYTDGTKDTFYHVSAVKGTKGNGIVSITTTYARSSQSSTASETTAPTIDGSWSSTMPTLTDTYKYLWRKEVTTYTDTSKNTTKYFLAAVKGQTGENGKDGWMVTANPANVIITQSLGTDSTSFSTQAVTFSAKKGNTSATITSLGTPTWTNFTGSKSGTTVTVTSPTRDRSNNYYTEGKFVVTVNVTDPDTSTNVAFSITVPCYANLLGTWKESVENGVKTVIAEEVDYDYLDGVLTKNGRTYTQTASAAGNYETWSTQADTVNGSKANMIKKTTTAQQTADGVSTKVSAITAEAGGQTVLKESQVTQYADKITASVTDGLTNTGIDIEHGKINLQADKVIISNDLIVPTVISENDDMRTTIQAGKLKIESKKNSSYGIFEINSLNEIVLQMFDKDGKCVINLGGTPNALVNGKWENMEMRTLTSTELQNPSKANLTANAVGSSFKPCTMYYRLVLGKLKNSDNVLEYFLPDGTKTEDTTIINLDGCVFTAKSNTPNIIKQLGKISGHFVKRNNGIFRSTMVEVIEEDTQYEEDVYYYVSGKVNKILKKMFSN